MMKVEKMQMITMPSASARGRRMELVYSTVNITAHGGTWLLPSQENGKGKYDWMMPSVIEI